MQWEKQIDLDVFFLLTATDGRSFCVFATQVFSIAVWTERIDEKEMP